MRQTHLFLYLTFLSLMCSCTFNSTYVDREEDKNEAKKTTDELFNDIKAKKFEVSYKLFSARFWEVTTKAKMQEIFDATQKKLGDLDSTSLEKWQTRVVKGTNPSSEYLFLFRNRYHNYPAQETIRLMKEDDGSVKIVAYNIQSDGFFK